VLVQYARFMKAPCGRLRRVAALPRDALGLVLERLPATLLLAARPCCSRSPFAVPLGIVTAVRRDRAVITRHRADVLGQGHPGLLARPHADLRLRRAAALAATAAMGGVRTWSCRPSCSLSTRARRAPDTLGVLDALGEDYC